jgi:lysozyme
MDAVEQIIRDEGGPRLKPYLDCCGNFWRYCSCEKKGHLTISVGVNLDEGISAMESFYLFQNRLNDAKNELNFHFPWAASRLNGPRYAVLLNMRYAMGIGRLLGFRKMLAAAKVDDYPLAADEIVDSKFYRGRHQARARRLEKQMRTGEWQHG